MIVNVWKPAPEDAASLLPLAHAHGWRNLPLCECDVRVAWQQTATAALGGVSLPAASALAPTTPRSRRVSTH